MAQPQEKKPLGKEVFAGMVATLVTHPLDLLKIRRQISARRCSTFRLARQIFKSESWRTFYCGLTAGLLRHSTNTATRLALYDTLYEGYIGKFNEEPPPSRIILIGICSSMAGGMVGNPSEMVLVRRMADGCNFSTPSGTCRCDSMTRGTLGSLVKIIREEGILGLWRGCSLTLLRSAMVSTIHIGCYECLKIREYLKNNNATENVFSLSLYALVVTHFVSALLTHPVDIVKSLLDLRNLEC